MSMSQHQPRRATLYNLISLTNRQRPQGGGIILSATDESSLDINAQNTSWDLLAGGLAHLADGGVNGEAGQLTAAVTKASLRSAPLAAALGIAPPVFKQTAVMSPRHDAHAEAVFLARRMTEAVAADITTSQDALMRNLVANTNVGDDIYRFFERLSAAHARQCDQLMVMIDRMPAPAPKNDSGGKFKF